ncbi:unnamed protein product, partial [Amoebophrya sp. A25]
ATGGARKRRKSVELEPPAKNKDEGVVVIEDSDEENGADLKAPVGALNDPADTVAKEEDGQIVPNPEDDFPDDVIGLEVYKCFIDQIGLTVREWIEVYYVCRWGMEGAQDILLESQFFETTEVVVDNEPKTMQVITLSTTAVKAVTLLKEAGKKSRQNIAEQKKRVNRKKQKKEDPPKEKKPAARSNNRFDNLVEGLTEAQKNPTALPGQERLKSPTKTRQKADAPVAEKRPHENMFYSTDPMDYCPGRMEEEDLVEDDEYSPEEIEAVAKDLKEGKGRAKLAASVLSFHRDDVDLAGMHIAELSRKMKIRCPTCAKHIGWCKKVWVTHNGPALLYKGPAEGESWKSVACGPARHLSALEKNGAVSCMCGWWKKGQLWSYSNCEE